MAAQTTTTQEMSVSDKLFTEACATLGRPVTQLEDFNHLPEEERQAFYSLYRITTVIKARKAGHKFNWNDYNEYKWSAFFDMEEYKDKPGSGFAFNDACCGFASTLVGARLCSPNESDTIDIAKSMIDDYKNWMKED